jgi:Bacterial protein of unknown function (DUF839)
LSIRDGICRGFYIGALAECQEFSYLPASSSLIYPYVPGELTVYDEATGLRLATGLSVRQIARSGEKVIFGSMLANQSMSSLPFHVEPDGAAVVATTDGGWIYVSNCESSLGKYKGGVYALAFDSDGEIKDYYTLLVNTTRNCNGGLTPWGTWVSCEETAHGQCWQVDPLGLTEPEPTAIAEPEGGNFEAFAYDIRNSSRPCFFITEDHELGALRRWCPDPTHLNETWNMLHGNGTREYLKIIPDTNRFEWTPYLSEGRNSAKSYFPQSEGISHKDGILYFVSKKLKRLFICNLDTGEFRTESTNDQGLLIGDGLFNAEPDYVIHGAGNDILYFLQDGGTPGVYARKTSTGEYFAIMEAEHARYKRDEFTGLSWSPDWTKLYVCIQDIGILFEVTRDDGLPFEHDDQQLRLNYHSNYAA